MNAIEWTVKQATQGPPRLLRPAATTATMPIATRLEVLRLLAMRLTYEEIASRVGISANMVKTVSKQLRKQNREAA